MRKRNIDRDRSSSPVPLLAPAASDRGEPSASPRAGRSNVPSGVLGGLAALRRGLTSALGNGGDKRPSMVPRTQDSGLSRASLRHDFPQSDATPAWLNRRDDKGDTPLGLAIAAGNTDEVRAMLEHPAVDANLANRHMKTPLHLAAARGNVEIVGLLMRHPGVAPGLPNKDGDIPLHLAAARNDPALANTLIDCSADVINQRNANGLSPLAIALHGGHHRVVAELLKHPDIDVNTKNPKGESLLHQATARSDAACAWLLLNDHRIRATERTPEGKDAMDLAMEHPHAEMVRVLAMDPTLANALDPQGRTPLDRAVDMHRHAALEALLESDNIDPNRPNIQHQTPLSRAVDSFTNLAQTVRFSPGHAYRNENETLALLVGSGKVDPNACFHNGETLLTSLCKMRPQREIASCNIPVIHHEALVRMLAAGGDRLEMNQVNRRGETALQACCTVPDTLNQRKIVQVLLEDKRTDPSVLTSWLMAHPQAAYQLLYPGKLDWKLSPDELNRFLDQTLAQWADWRRAHGGGQSLLR